MKTKTKTRVVESLGEVAEAAPLAAPTRRVLSEQEKVQESLKTLEDDMLAASLDVVGGAMDFIELDPENPEMPQGWERKYGKKIAERRLRAARAGLASAKEAPVGIKVATQFAVGALKARATERGGTRSLNINVINFAVRKKEYVEMEIED